MRSVSAAGITILGTLAVFPVGSAVADPAGSQGVETAAHAKEDVIVTDRPDVAESPQTVGKLRFQVELGLDVETRDAGEVRVTDFRTPLKVRFGLLDWLELHLETDGVGLSHVDPDAGDPNTEAGFADLDLGGKAHLIDQRGLVPSTGVLLALTLPIGADGLSPGDAFLLSPTVAAGWDHLPGELGLAINLGVAVALSDRDAAADTVRYALAVGRSWAPLTDALGSYIEIYGETAFDGGDTALALDGGFTWLVRHNLQLDLMARVGLTGEAPDVGGALGISYKL